MERRWVEISVRFARHLRTGSLARAWSAADAEARDLCARGPPGAEEVEVLARLAVLAAQYGEDERALRWVSEFEEAFARGARRAEVRATAEAIRLAVELASKEYGGAERRLRSIEWRDLRAAPWAANLRLLAAVWARDDALFLEILRGREGAPTSGAESLGALPHPAGSAYDRGNRLRILALWFFHHGRWERGLACLAPALREFGRDRAIDARLREIEVRGLTATAAYYIGRIDEAEDMLEAAIAAAEEVHHTAYRDTFREQLALVWVEKEDLERAERLLESVAAEAGARGRRRPVDHFLRTSALLNAAAVAVERKDLSCAERRLRQARRLLEARDHPRYRGHLHILIGRLAAEEGRGDSGARALEHYDIAEDYFNAAGGGDLVGIAVARIHRSRLHLRLRDLRAALAEAERAADAARRSRHPPAEAACVLLKSQILLEEEGSQAEGLYEEVIGNLGLVRSPVSLLKVIANLYLFSWELGDQLDLTAWHLGQIHRLAEIIDRTTFDRLYGELVVEKVLKRAISHTLGNGAEGDR